MKNNYIYKIPQNKIKEILGINQRDWEQLKRVFNIATVEPISFNLLKGLIDYQSKTGKKDIIDFSKAKESKLKEFKILEEDFQEIKTPSLEVKKIKKSPIKKQKKKVVKKEPVNINPNFIKFTSHKTAAKAYNQELKNVYYSLKPAISVAYCIAFDVKKTFLKNINEVKEKYPKQKIFLYSDNTTYDKSQRVHKTKKARVWTKEEDKKILDYYNSDYYKKINLKFIKNPYSMEMLSKDINVDRKQIAIRASALGFTNFKTKREKEYKDEEIEILNKYTGIKSSSQLQKILKSHGFTRSQRSINVKIQRLKLSAKLNGKGDLNLRLLGELLGLDQHSIDRNQKLIEYMQPKRQDGQLLFCRKKLKNFIMENPYEFNLGKVDNKFFIELLTTKEV